MMFSYSLKLNHKKSSNFRAISVATTIPRSRIVTLRFVYYYYYYDASDAMQMSNCTDSNQRND